jgi:hypothetical protein
MAQEFTINSSAIESKINQLLPSQGGFGAGVDFSASTMVIPIVDLTETAEGSDVRVDLQTALSLNSVTSYLVNNATTTLVTTTGYFRVFGTAANTAAVACRFELTDGTTTKRIREFNYSGGTSTIALSYDFIVFLEAGVSLVGVSGSGSSVLTGTTRQIADISGNLINP